MRDTEKSSPGKDKEKAPLEEKRSFSVTGMTCATCSRMVEKALNKVEGVTFAAVNLATETAFVILDRDLPMEVLERAVEKAGYGVSYETPEDAERTRYRAARTDLLLSWGITLPLMILMIFHMSGKHVPGFYLMELSGGGVVIFLAGRKSVKGAWIALSHFHANMDVLVVLGSSAALVTSLLAMTELRISSFGTIGSMIMGLHLTGRFIESYLRDRASKEIKALLTIQAREARIVDEQGREFSLPIEAVKEGFQVIVRPGERIPVDGEIIEGKAAVDESMITGESLPVEKIEGMGVTGGSLDLTGVVRIRVSKVGEDTFLSQMISLIQEAQGTKIPIQAFADRVTNYFVPVIVLLAFISGVFWYLGVDRFHPFLDHAEKLLPWVTHLREPLSIGFFAFVTTMVIACPCALGLATPMALITGTGAASREGIIIRNAEAIQTSKDIGVVILDKTGTITMGEPSVVEWQLPEEDLEAVVSIERNSNHPLAKAISRLSPRELPVAELEEIAGHGIKGKVEGREYLVGKPSGEIDYSAHFHKGRTVVEVKEGDIIRGYLSIEDPIREETRDAIKRFRSRGILPVMATGDNETTARAVAAEAGIEEIFAGVKPEEKLAIVRRFQSRGRKVLMVGDGMNDAAALKGADVGVAIGSGTELAIDSADVVIVRGGVDRIADLVDISGKTFNVIRQNLFWAFSYNIIAIPLAMAALLHPLIAESAMAFSSISVILNSMRVSSPSKE